MKHHGITIMAAALLAGLAAGCGMLRDHKDEIHAAIIELVETKGRDAATAYVDKLVEEGKLGAANAEKIKSAIPQDIDKLKEAMGE